MRKRNTLLAIAGLIVAVGAGASIYLATRPTEIPTKWTEAVKMRTTGSCLAADPAINIPSDKSDSIELAAISQLTDVPAGTNVDVKIASYKDNKITGSDRYPSKYGSYNFAMEKRQNGDWIVTEFKHCK
jgi:hypothetical protein